MSKVLNEGITKQVKLSTGKVIDIPQGISTQPDDAQIKRLVNSDPKIKFITNKELSQTGPAEKQAEKPATPQTEKPVEKADEDQPKKKRKSPDKKEEDKTVNTEK